MEADAIIEMLGLKPLPEEGGFYREMYRAKGVIPGEALPMHAGERTYSTLIFYLVTPEEFSGLHRVKSDEVFHFTGVIPQSRAQKLRQRHFLPNDFRPMTPGSGPKTHQNQHIRHGMPHASRAAD
jgi:hypothetical protein